MLALALAAGPAGAQAPSTAPAPAPAPAAASGFALFQKACIASRANPAAIIAAAQAAGFEDPSADLKARLVQDIAGSDIEGGDMRILPHIGGGAQALVFGAKRAAQGDPFPVAVKLNLCFLITPTDAVAEKALADWVAIPSDKTVANAVAFNFMGDPHRPVTGLSPADADAAAKRGDLQVAAAMEQSSVTVLIYGRNQPQ
jgi:hypothetical protein